MNTKIISESKNKHDKIFYKTIEDFFEEIDTINGEKRNLKEIIYNNYITNKTLEKEINFKKIEGFDGPFIGKYLKGFSPQFKNRVFNTINETLLHFHKDDFALGITLNRNGKYTIRRSNTLQNSKINTNNNTEISWILKKNNNIDIKKNNNIDIKKNNNIDIKKNNNIDIKKNNNMDIKKK